MSSKTQRKRFLYEDLGYIWPILRDTVEEEIKIPENRGTPFVNSSSGALKIIMRF